MTNPFPLTISTPGRGSIELISVPPKASALRQVSYQYPLKLVAPAPITSQDEQHVQTVYLLTYGGGLVAGDKVNLSISLDSDTRLILLTQGSTKIFKSPSPSVLTSQLMTVSVQPGAALCYLPDPVQPFERSCFEQRQVYNLTQPDSGMDKPAGSICVLDWVSRGRTARGENWNMLRYASRNDVWLGSPQNRGRLLLRDNLVLQPDSRMQDGGCQPPTYSEQMHGTGVFGTLILYGALFQRLAQFFHDEFKLIPRIGGRKWDTAEPEQPPSAEEILRAQRHQMEAADDLTWTVASLRGCTVVKFGAREVEGGKKWLKIMLESEQSVVHCFGERALLCLR